MSAFLRVAPLTPELESEWDALALASADAWFWQTTSWIKWATAIASSAFAGAHSFVLQTASGEVAGICPVNVEERSGERTFAFLGGPIPAPAFSEKLSPAERDQALELYVETIAGLARREQVMHGSVKMPFTTALKPDASPVNPWLRFGYFDLPYLTQVVDLRLSESELWSAMRKGHRSDVKRAQKAASVQVWDRSTISSAKMDEYQALHAKDAGRVTRSRTTFDLMEGWIRDGHAILAETHLDGRAVAFAVIIHYKSGAFYASGCREPELADFPGSHLLQWEAMRWLKQHGCALYDIGIQFTGPQWFYVPTPKEVSISAFKRGFGGATVPLVTAERFYEPASLQRTFDARIRAYLAATAPDAVHS